MLTTIGARMVLRREAEFVSSDHPDAAETVRLTSGGLWRRHGLRLVATTVGVLLLAAGGLSLMPRLYQSHAVIAVDAAGQGTGERAIAARAEQVLARDVLLSAIETQGLRGQPEFSAGNIWSIDGLLQLVGMSSTEAGNDAVLARLLERVEVVPEVQSGLLTVTVTSEGPERAAGIANAIAGAYVDSRTRQAATDAAEANARLSAEVERQRAKLTEAETAVATYKAEHGLTSGADAGARSVAEQIAAARADKVAALQKAQNIRAAASAGTMPGGLDHAALRALLDQRAGIEAEYAERNLTLLPAHPTMRSLQSQLDDIDARIAGAADAAARGFERQAAEAGQLETRLLADQKRAEALATDVGNGGLTLDMLEREARTQSDLLQSYMTRYADGVASGASTAMPDVRVLATATPASAPSFPRTLEMLAAIGLAALAIQVALILLSELRAPRQAAEPELASEDEAESDRQFAEVEAEAVAEEPRRAEVLTVTGRDELAALSAAVTSGDMRMVLLAQVGDVDTLPVVERLLQDAVEAGDNVVIVDATGLVSDVPGLTDLAADQADYGDVLHLMGDHIAEVRWGTHEALDRDSPRPATLIAALADIYRVVIVNTGAVTPDSSLPAFAGIGADVVLVADGGAGVGAAARARQQVGSFGFSVGRVVALGTPQMDMARAG